MMVVKMAAAVLAAMTIAQAQAQQVIQWAAPAAQTGQYAYFPMGTSLQLTTRTELNTKSSRAGDRFYLEVVEPLVYRGQVVVPVGSTAVGEVMRAERNGVFGKKGQLEVRLLYVQTPSGPVRLSGRVARSGKGQGVLAIGGGVILAWPLLFVHGTSGKLTADTPMTAYLAEELRFAVQQGAQRGASVAPDRPAKALPASFDPSVFAANRD